MKFELNDEQMEKLRIWSKAQDEAVLAKQRMDLDRDAFQAAVNAGGHPYYGAIGGGLTFLFTPTSIGDVVTVKHSVTGEELDLSDEGGFG